MALHHLELLDRELPGRQEDVVGDADLADVVEAGRAPQEVHVPLGNTQLLGEERRHASDAERVLARVVVSVFGGQRQALERLDVGVLELFGSFLHPILERPLLRFQLQVKEADVEHVRDPEKHLVDVQRLREEVSCASGERTTTGVRRRVGGKDENREIRILRDRRAKHLHHAETIEVRHQKIEQDEIGLERWQEFFHSPRVGCRHDVLVAAQAEDTFE